MNTRLSARVKAVKPSPTLAVTARAAEMRAAGKDVIGLGAGEPGSLGVVSRTSRDVVERCRFPRVPKANKSQSKNM